MHYRLLVGVYVDEDVCHRWQVLPSPEEFVDGTTQAYQYFQEEITSKKQVFQLREMIYPSAFFENVRMSRASTLTLTVSPVQ